MRARKANEFFLKDDYAIIMVGTKLGAMIEVLIDLDDVELCKQYYWSGQYSNTVKDYYIQGYKDGKTVRLHRLVTNCPDGLVVDHVRHQTRDNRKSQLRVCTQLTNMQNVRRSKDNNKNGHIGLSWVAGCKKWTTKFTREKKSYNLGVYRAKNMALFMRHFFELQYKQHEKIKDEDVMFLRMFLTSLEECFSTKHRPTVYEKLIYHNNEWMYARKAVPA